MMFRSLLLATMALGCAGDKAPPGDDDDDTTPGDDDDDDDSGPASPVGEWRMMSASHHEGTTATTPSGGSTYSVTGSSYTTLGGTIYTVNIEGDGSWSLRREYTSTSDIDGYRNLVWYEDGEGFVLVSGYQHWECSFMTPDEVLCDVTVDYGHVARAVMGRIGMERI